MCNASGVTAYLLIIIRCVKLPNSKFEIKYLVRSFSIPPALMVNFWLRQELEEYSFVSASWHFIKYLKVFFSSWLLIPKGRLAVFMFTSWNQFNNVCIKCSMAITEESIYVMLSLNVESYPKWVVGGLLLLCYYSGQSLTARDRSSLCPGSMKNILRNWISWRL